MKKIFIIGFLIGLIFPFIGIFIGLQVSTTLGNIFAFPFVLGAMIFGVPFGQWSGMAQLSALLVSGLVWGGATVVIAKISRMK